MRQAVPFPPPPTQTPTVRAPQGVGRAPLVAEVVTPARKNRPIIRAQNNDDEPSRPTPMKTVLLLPSPQQLGITQRPAQTTTMDWNTIHARLRQLGAVGFQLRKQRDGAWRASFTLPTADPDRKHIVEVTAGSDMAAVHSALRRAEQWASQS